MTEEMAKKINDVLTADFFNENAMVDNMDSFYAKVTEIDDSIERTELETYLKVVSQKMHDEENDEINEKELEEVAGGFAWTTLAAIAAGVAAVTKVVSFCYNGGKAVGEFVYNLGH